MISVKDALRIHKILIDKFGGIEGIRDEGFLESAINRPFATFEGKDLYPSPVDKAAALIESIIMNHPFLDGNKRIGYVLMRLVLMKYGLDIEATQDDKYIFVVKISKGELNIDKIKQWIGKWTKPRNGP